MSKSIAIAFFTVAGKQWSARPWKAGAACQCEYNARGFLENECFECVADATEAAHSIEQSPERGSLTRCGDDDCEECNVVLG